MYHTKMSGNDADSKKSEVGELRALLRSPEIQKDAKQYEQVVQKVIAYMTLGVDVSPLFSEMIMAGASPNIVQKKMVYLYLGSYAERNSELALLTVNTLRKDANERNPTVRGLALRSMCSLRIPNIVEYIQDPLQAGLHDKSPYVRRTAVVGVLKLFYIAPDLISDMNLVDHLYQMLRDDDPLVVCNCLSALEEILANEGGIIITRKMAHYLINRLRDFSEWGQCQVLQMLLRYKASDEEEVFDLLNVLDDRLKHVMVGVVLATIRLFFHLTEDLPDIHADVFERIKSPLLTLVGSAPSEVVYVCLQHIEILLHRNRNLFSQDYHNFYYRYNDPPYVKLRKLDLLTQVCDDVNAHDIVQELGECATDVNSQVARKSIQAIGKIAVNLSGCANMCVDKLLALLTMEIDYITSEAIATMTNILRKFEDTHEVILPRLTGCYEIMTDPQGRSSLIWIIGEYGESLTESPYLLEEIVTKVGDESSFEVKLQLLSAVMKLFFKRPPECQEMLGRLLEYFIDEETDMLLRDRGLLYYRLLKADVNAAKQIICGSQKIFSEFASPSKAASLFSEMNTLAVIYSQSSSDFIEQCPPYTLINVTEKTRKMSHLDQIFMSTSAHDGAMTTNIMDELSSSASTVPHILLNPKLLMSPTEFEQKWGSLTVSSKKSFELKSIGKLKNIQDLLDAKFIFTLASSSDNQPIMKMFLFAQHVSTFDQFLAEVIITLADKKMKVIIKAENNKLVNQFLLHYMDALNVYIHTI